MPTKILAVDDSKTIRLAIKITFAAEDAEVVAINKGSDALARAKQMRPDVILVDQTLGEGDLSGAALCQQLRADSDTRAIPIVLMVPARGGIAGSTASAAGADAVIGKPFDTQELLDRVAELAKSGTRSTHAPSAAAVPAASPAAAPIAAPASPASFRPSSPQAAAATPTRTAAPAAASRTVSKAPVSPVAAVSQAPAMAQASAAVSAAPSAAIASNAVGVPEIPLVMAIPFSPAGAPSAGMLERLRKAGATAGVSPQALEALAALSSDVIERIVWEVVPDLAEAIVRERAEQMARH
jgi:CheY-like chemotaxis protein